MSESTSPKRPGMKVATGFLFTIVASLLVGDFLDETIHIVNTAPALLTVVVLLGVAVNLFRIVIDHFVYYETHEADSADWPVYRWRLVLTVLELGVLLMCYDLVYQVNLASIEAAGGVFPQYGAKRILFDFGLVELIWVIWDLAYIRSARALQRQPEAADRAEDVPLPVKDWLTMNLFWGFTFVVSTWVLFADGDAMLRQSPVNEAQGFAFLGLAVACAVSYVLRTRVHYSRT